MDTQPEFGIVDLQLEEEIENKLADGQVPADLEDEIFDYLGKLRQCGYTNMFMAGTWLEHVFHIDKREARALVTKWMESFERD